MNSVVTCTVNGMESFLFISDLLNWKQDTYFERDYRPVMVLHQHEGSALNGVINLMIKTDHVKMP